MKKLLLSLVVLLSMTAMAEQKNGIVYVKPGGAGDGTSWANAMGDIQTAINTARADKAARKDVWVAAGDYTIGTAIVMSDSISLYGSFAGTETAVDQRTKLTNGKPWEFTNSTILTANNCRLIETASNFDMATIVDGFILTNGNGIGTTLSKSGGAAVVRNNMVIQNCVIQNSTALDGAGGGLNMTGETVKNSWIYNNRQTTNANGGGGIYINTASGNETTVENCKIEKNSSTIRGGGINVQGVGFTYLKNLYIVNNKSEDSGTPKAGAAIYANSATNTATNCIISNNSGLTTFYIKGNVFNCTMVNNIGGAYLAEASATIELSNNIFWGMFTDITETTSTSLSGAANANATINNNATYNPIPTDKNWKTSGNIQFSSNISNGDVTDPAPGTVGSGPKFYHVTRFRGTAAADEEILSLDSADWRIKYNSPCLNIGKTLVATNLDYLGVQRPQGHPTASAQYDMGAYELPYRKMLIGEGTNTNGTVYDSNATQLPDGTILGYPEGTVSDFLFEAKPGYKLLKAAYITGSDDLTSFDGQEVDITDKIDAAGIWHSHPLVKSLKLYAVWSSTSGLENIDYVYSVFATKNKIIFSKINQNDKVSVYTITGNLIFNKKADTPQFIVPVEKGIYIVRINNLAKKVVVE